MKLADMSDIDEVIFSIKAISPDLHRAYTGKDNAAILENFRKLGYAIFICEMAFIFHYYYLCI